MLNEYQTQNSLNPKLWDEFHLKGNLQEKFLEIAKHFYEFLETDATILDIILIGSNANYNWTKYSDIDLHVVINYLEVGDNLHLVEQYLRAKKSIWNTNYPLKYKGMNIELYAQDSNDELHSSVGVYSLYHNKWIRKPSADIISIDDSDIEHKAAPYEYEINALKSDDPNLDYKIKDILDRLRNLRASGLEASGEYSIENLAYKHLRNKGYLGKLKELLHKSTYGKLNIDESVIESLAKHVNKQSTLSESEWSDIITKTNAIEDPMGQWKHPGRCTMIPSNNITMKNVPHQVLGIDDTGHMQLMKPEMTYTFPGKRVFEIPRTPQWQTLMIQLANKIKNGARYVE
jgi:hypothetical protein